MWKYRVLLSSLYSFASTVVPLTSYSQIVFALLSSKLPLTPSTSDETRFLRPLAMIRKLYFLPSRSSMFALLKYPLSRMKPMLRYPRAWAFSTICSNWETSAMDPQ